MAFGCSRVFFLFLPSSLQVTRRREGVVVDDVRNGADGGRHAAQDADGRQFPQQQLLPQGDRPAAHTRPVPSLIPSQKGHNVTWRSSRLLRVP